MREIELNFIEEAYRMNYYNRNPTDLAVADRSYQEIYLRASPSYKHYHRKDYDILTYLSDLGGLFEIAVKFGGLITSYIVGKLVNAALISDAYKIQGADSNLMNSTIIHNRSVSGGIRKTLFKVITNLRTLRYGFSDIFISLFKCANCRSSQHLRK